MNLKPEFLVFVPLLLMFPASCNQSTNKEHLKSISEKTPDLNLDPASDPIIQAATELFVALKYREAESLIRQRLAHYERLRGKNNDTVICLTINLADCMYRQDNFTGAEPLLLHSIGYFEASESNELALARAYSLLAGVYAKTSRREQAIPLYEQAIEIAEAIVGVESPTVSMYMSDLALVYRKENKGELAVTLQRRVLEMLQKTVASDDPNLATAYNNLATTYLTLGKRDDAEPLYRNALEIREKVYGSRHESLYSILKNLANICAATGRLADAQRLSKRADNNKGSQE